MSLSSGWAGEGWSMLAPFRAKWRWSILTYSGPSLVRAVTTQAGLWKSAIHFVLHYPENWFAMTRKTCKGNIQICLPWNLLPYFLHEKWQYNLWSLVFLHKGKHKHKSDIQSDLFFYLYHYCELISSFHHHFVSLHHLLISYRASLAISRHPPSQKPPAVTARVPPDFSSIVTLDASTAVWESV